MLAPMDKTRCSVTTKRMSLGILAGAMLMALASGCGTTIGLTSDRYQPQFDPAPLASYNGRAILLRNFENVDNNTSFYRYPGAGRHYGGPVLTSYFWYCFKAAFTKLGVNVFDESLAQPGVPSMEVKLVRIDEAGYTAQVTVMGGPGQPPLQKSYSVAGPPITDRQPAALESRAYQMMTGLFWNIVADPAFQSAVLR
jgi:hypothetical protein